MAAYPQFVSYVRTFFMVSSTDHFSKKTGASPVVNLSKAGAAFGATAGAVAEVSDGWYTVTLSTADAGTQGDLAFHITGTGADDTDFVDQVTDPVRGLGGPTALPASGTLAVNPTLAGVTHTGAVIPTVTTLTNLPAITANWLTAAGIAAAALNGKGDWALASLFTGITSVAEWLGLLAGKQVGNATARTEIRATGAGAGTFDETTDSEEAIRDNIGTAGAGLTAIDLPNQTMDITGNLSGSVGSVTGAVGSVTGLTAATVHADLDDIQARLPAALTANGNMKSSLIEILTTALTETAGQITAAFKQFFDIAAPTGTMKAITNVVTATNLTTNNDKTGYALAAGGIGAGVIAAAELNAIADAFLDRNMATGTDSGTDSTATRTPRQALRILRNKRANVAGTVTVRKEDDVTASWTAAATTAAGNPTDSIDPT